MEIWHFHAQCFFFILHVINDVVVFLLLKRAR